MSVDHVTYMMTRPELRAGDMLAFMNLCGLREIKPDPVIEKDWEVRWFSDARAFQIHLVVGPRTPELELSHFCVVTLPHIYEAAKRSPWLERDSGSGRIWLKGPGGLRVEMRPNAATVADRRRG